ncbi:hypothetical protein ACFLYB_04825 [Chloroflexota bacterium]
MATTLTIKSGTKKKPIIYKGIIVCIKPMEVSASRAISLPKTPKTIRKAMPIIPKAPAAAGAQLWEVVSRVSPDCCSNYTIPRHY